MEYAMISTISGNRTVYGDRHEAEVAAEWISKETGVLYLVLPLEDAWGVEETLKKTMALMNENDAEYLSASTDSTTYARMVAIQAVQRTYRKFEWEKVHGKT